MHVEVAYALPQMAHRVHLEMPEGATVADALAAIASVAPFSELDLTDPSVAIFGRLATTQDTLRHGDRIDILRPLLVDPKEARRQRALRQ